MADPQFGLSIDNLISAEVVTADGQVLRAAAAEHSGSVLGDPRRRRQLRRRHLVEFRLHEVGPMVQFGMFFWGLDQGPEAMRLAREVTAAMPPDINAVLAAVNAPPAPFVPRAAPLRARLRAAADRVRIRAGARPARHPIRERVPPLFDLITPMPSSSCRSYSTRPTPGASYSYEKGTYVEDLSDAVIAVVTEHVPRKPSPMSALLFYRLDGAYCRVGDDQTAFSGGRSPRYGTFIIGLVPEPALLPADRGWVRDLWKALRPHAIGSGDGYINGSDEIPRRRRTGLVRASGTMAGFSGAGRRLSDGGPGRGPQLVADGHEAWRPRRPVMR